MVPKIYRHFDSGKVPLPTSDEIKNQSNDILQHSQNRLTGDRWLKL